LFYVIALITTINRAEITAATHVCQHGNEKKQPTTGLERVAEELMGRRKWKQYQDSLAQSNATDLLDKQSPSIGEFKLRKFKRFLKKIWFFDF
jgi:hypothetical protein